MHRSASLKNCACVADQTSLAAAACCRLLQGYLPRDLYQLDSAYGSEADLRELIQECHNHNIKVIADIVINHR